MWLGYFYSLWASVSKKIKKHLQNTSGLWLHFALNDEVLGLHECPLPFPTKT